MKYAYEDLGDKQFETLVAFICQELFGLGVQTFSTGPDGGRDAKFIGTAQLYPSVTSPWTGTTIIQAKHTNGYNKRFSDPDFFNPNGNSNTVLGKEIPRVKKLRETKQLDNYILFSNRRLAANAQSAIQGNISKTCGIPEESVAIVGIEQIELWLKQFPDIAERADLDPIDSPLIVSPDDLAEVVEALAENKNNIPEDVYAQPTQRTSFVKKNKLNNMTDEYAKEQTTRFLKETVFIQDFLAAPENSDLLERYEATVEEFQLKIIAKRKDHQTFDRLMEYLIDLLFGRDPVLRKQKNKRLTRAVLFYMYWHCDIGVSDNA